MKPWSTLGLLRLHSFSFGITGTLLAMDTLILPVMILDLAPDEFKNTYLGILGIGGLFVAAVVQLAVGGFSDRTKSRLGKRVPYLLVGSVLTCAGLASIPLVPNYAVLAGVWFFMQGSLNLAYGPCLALIRDMVPATQIGVASSIKILSDAAGAASLIALSGALIDRDGGLGPVQWEWITLGLIAFSLLTAAGVTSHTVLSRESHDAPEPASPGPRLTGLSSLHPQLGLFLLSRMLLITAIAALQTYGLFFLRDSVGLEDPAQSLASMILVIGGAMAVGVWASGGISDRIGRKPLVLVGSLAAALSTIWMLTAADSTDVLIRASLIGFSTGILLSANWALANDIGSKESAALHMGIVNLSTVAGAATAKLLGPGIDLLNRSSEGSGYHALIIGCGVLFLIGALLVMPIKGDTWKKTAASETA